MSQRKTDRATATAAAILAAATLLAGGSAGALEMDAQLKLGEIEYMGSCASCHGPRGKGDGPVAEVLATKPSDLTQISRDFGGTFPAEHVYQVIDGRNMINPHGDPNMPVWGFRYLTRAVERSREVPHDVDVQALVHGRITALVQYLESIQAE